MKISALVVALSLGFSVNAMAAGDADQDFVTKASQAGMAEVKLGQLSMDHGSAAAVKEFGKRMVDDHGKANIELKAIAAKTGKTMASEPSAEQQKTAEALKNKTGNEFDASYAKTMVKDHEEAVALFKKEASSGENAQLKKFAEQTLPTLESHLQMAQHLPQGK